MDERDRRPVGGSPGRCDPGDAGQLRRHRAGLPLPRPPGRHALRRRGPAHQDDPPPGLGADRHHLRLRRTHRGAAPARHPAHERPAAGAAGQGQHRARRRAQARDHRHRRPRHRYRPRRRPRRRSHPVRRFRRGARAVRHRHRAALPRPDPAQARHPHPGRRDRNPRGRPQQPPRRRRGHTVGRAHRRHRRGRLRQVLADRFPAVPRRHGHRRPVRHPRLPALQPRHLHRRPGTRPQGLRQGQRRHTRPVLPQLRGCVPQLQGCRRCLRGSGDHVGRGRPLRSVRGAPLRRGGPRLPPRRPRHRRGAGHAGGRGRGVLLRPRFEGAGGREDLRPACRRRPGLHHPRPAADHPVRRRAPAAQARRAPGGEYRRVHPR